jgi:hypothetical protein
VYWRPSRKVEDTKTVRPAIPVPCPASNRIIDYCRPDKHEDQGRSKAPAFSDSADRDHRAREICLIYAKYSSPIRKHIRDCSKHQLVDTEDDRRDSVAANRRFL